MYLYSSFSKQVRSANIDGTNIQDVVYESIADPEQIAVDWIGKRK